MWVQAGNKAARIPATPGGCSSKGIFWVPPGATQAANKYREASQLGHKHTQEKPETCAKDQMGIQAHQLESI